MSIPLFHLWVVVRRQLQKVLRELGPLQLSLKLSLYLFIFFNITFNYSNDDCLKPKLAS